MKKIILILISLQILLAQSVAAQTEGDDFLHSTGKIYVVVAVLVAIFIGITLFLVYLERKLTKLESQIED